MVAVVDDVKRFPDAKSFASYLGLVPREHSSGDARRLGSVTKAGNETLRRYLIHGGRAVLSSKNFQKDPLYIWGKRIEAKRGTNKASVALAHKLSRICFALLRDGSDYAKGGERKKSKAAA
jgi:transposase